jgi:DNA replication protein DnaC
MTLQTNLRELGLPAVAKEIDDILALATKKRWSPMQFIEHVAQLELKEKARRSLERRLSRSKIGHFRPMEDFDWSWPKKIDRQLVESCIQLDFLNEPRNVVLVAPHGLGKTMIAKNIAHQAITSGRTVSLVTASQLMLDLGSKDSARTLDLRLKYYAKQGLLVIDEVGYLAYDNRSADLLFQIVNMRYEKKSIVLTTNLAFSDWPTIFPNATCATALIDRVVHHADIIAIEGESYRRREAEQSAKTRKKVRDSAKKSGPKKRGSS